MNYSIPVYREQPSKKLLKFLKEDLDNILDQQILISQLSNGITFNDINDMDEYERIYTINKLFKLKREELEAKQKAYDQMKNKK